VANKERDYRVGVALVRRGRTVAGALVTITFDGRRERLELAEASIIVAHWGLDEFDPEAFTDGKGNVVVTKRTDEYRVVSVEEERGVL
jgi:hypothetical protein